MKFKSHIPLDFFKFHIYCHQLVQMENRTANKCEYKFGNNANIANFVYLWKVRMLYGLVARNCPCVRVLLFPLSLFSRSNGTHCFCLKICSSRSLKFCVWREHRFRDTLLSTTPRLWATCAGVKPVLAKKLLQLWDFAKQQHWFSQVISMEILTGCN